MGYIFICYMHYGTRRERKGFLSLRKLLYVLYNNIHVITLTLILTLKSTLTLTLKFNPKVHSVHNSQCSQCAYTMLQHVLWRGSTRIIKDAAPARLVLRTSGTAATWIYNSYIYIHVSVTPVNNHQGQAENTRTNQK